jgi:uncharacterized protein (DUF697 family)
MNKNIESEQKQKSEENLSYLSKKIQETLNEVVKDRSEDYLNGKPIISLSNVPDLISSTSRNNALISGGLNLIPGPWGMAAAIPEIVLIIKNQLNLIYDIGKSYGFKKDKLTPDLILAIFASTVGSKTIGILTMQGGKVLVRRSSLKVVQKLTTIIGGKVTQQIAKSTIAKYIPVVGAAGMAAWSNYSTKKIGNRAHKLFSKKFEFETENENIEFHESQTTTTNTTNTNSSNHSIELTKVKILINLMKIDGKLQNSEAEFVNNFIASTELDDDSKSYLISCLSSTKLLSIDLKDFDFNESIPLILDMISLAKSDDDFNITEKMYIKQIGESIGLSKIDIGDLLEHKLSA